MKSQRSCVHIASKTAYLRWRHALIKIILQLRHLIKDPEKRKCYLRAGWRSLTSPLSGSESIRYTVKPAHRTGVPHRDHFHMILQENNTKEVTVKPSTPRVHASNSTVAHQHGLRELHTKAGHRVLNCVNTSSSSGHYTPANPNASTRQLGKRETGAWAPSEVSPTNGAQVELARKQEIQKKSIELTYYNLLKLAVGASFATH